MTDMKEDFETLLKATPPPASEDARKAAIARGMDAFDAYFSKNSQAEATGNRLRKAVSTFQTMILRGFMNKNQLVGGAVTVAIGVALFCSSGVIPLMMGEAPAPVSSTSLPPMPESGAVKGKERMMEPANNASAPEPATQMKSLSAPVAPAIMPSPMPSPMSPPSVAGGMALDAEPLERLKPQPRMQAGTIGGAAQEAAASIAAPASAVSANKVFAFRAQRDADKSVAYADHAESRDRFETVKTNPLKVTAQEPVSTFSVDVDTASYSFVRASLNQNLLPPKDAVRIEEMVNYFPYAYAAPLDRETPFKANVAVMPSPWNSKTKLLHIGIKGYQIEQKEKPRTNLVFLIDTSGSMNEPNKLPLAKNALKLLLGTLQPEDTIGLVTYAGNAGVALEPTPVREKDKIVAALDRLQPAGSTAGAEGIRLAYQLAARNKDKNGINRVILATDGDFNVGITNQQELKGFIERERDGGIYLSVLGFGMGNYNDALMQTLAQNGNGNAAYIDNLNEARKALVDEAGSTLFPIAGDVKIQVEFNPARVAEYRLIGYETRLLNREDFNNDKVDAGDIGAGHTVTALYEITPTGSDAQMVDGLRYQEKPAEQEKAKQADVSAQEYAFVKIRYKLPGSDTSKLITTPVDSHVETKDVASAPQEARFAAAVAAFGQMLRQDPYTHSYSYAEVINLAQSAKGEDLFGYRAEFINLVRLAEHAATLPGLQGGGAAPGDRAVTPDE